jgi:hypothetical protein
LICICFMAKDWTLILESSSFFIQWIPQYPCLMSGTGMVSLVQCLGPALQPKTFVPSAHFHPTAGPAALRSHCSCLF